MVLSKTFRFFLLSGSLFVSCLFVSFPFLLDVFLGGIVSVAKLRSASVLEKTAFRFSYPALITALGNCAEQLSTVLFFISNET